MEICVRPTVQQLNLPHTPEVIFFIDNKTFKQCHSFYRHVLSKFFAAAEVSLLNSFQVSSTH